MKQKGNAPDFNVSAYSRSGEHKGRVGAAWKNEDGTIGIKLNPFVVLSASKDLVITLYPVETHTPLKKTKKEEQEIPF